MTIPNSFELAHDSEFRLLANFTTPPRAGRITVIEPSGQVRVATDDPDGGDVLAWPLNGFTYAVDDVVYIAFAANSPDTAIVIGAKAPLPTLEPAVYSHDHDSAYVKQDGTTTLDADWDIGEDRRIKAEAFRARDGEGLTLENDDASLTVRIDDSGGVVMRRSADGPLLDLGAQSITESGTVFVSGFSRANTDQARFTMVQLAGTSAMMGGAVSGESFRRIVIRADGQMLWGGGSAARDTNLYRSSADHLKTDDDFIVAGDLSAGVDAALGKVHAHDGTGGLLFVSKTGIDGTPQTIIANGAGDVTGGITGFFVVNDGGGAVANAFTMLLGDNLDIVVGGYTMRLALNVNGALTAVRQSGVGTGTLVLLAVWM